MSDVHVLACLAPESLALGNVPASLRLYFAFSALQIKHIVSEAPAVRNPLGIPSPHDLYIEQNDVCIPLGDEVRFRRLNSLHKLPSNAFLTPWKTMCGVLDLYLINTDLYLLFDIDSLLHNAGCDV